MNAQGEKVEVVLTPYPVLDKDFIELDRDKFSRPDKLLFVGTQYHFPNKDGIEWFLEEIAPTIFKKFGLRLHVVGSWSQETKQRYKDHPSQVIFTGFVDDLSSLIESKYLYISDETVWRTEGKDFDSDGSRHASNHSFPILNRK